MSGGFKNVHRVFSRVLTRSSSTQHVPARRPAPPGPPVWPRLAPGVLQL